MSTRVGTGFINSKKAPLHPQNGKRMEIQKGKSQPAEKTGTSRRRSARERKLALLEDVDNLKKKLRHEENVHRALERAFTRPLGALPRLPPYLPQYTLELLAEVAVLEEEVVRLEEQIVNFKQGLYQEAASISTRRSVDDSIASSNELSIQNSKRSHSRSLSQSEVKTGSFLTRASLSLSRSASTRKFLSSDDSFLDSERQCSERLMNSKQPQSEPSLASVNGSGKVSQPSSKSDKNKRCPEKKSLVIETPVKRRPSKPESLVKSASPLKLQCRISEQSQASSSGSSDDRVPDLDSEANKMSEDILKCLISIFVRLRSSRGKTMDLGSLASKEFSEKNVDSVFKDPYFNYSEITQRDIGNYKYFHAIEARSLDLNRKTNASFLIRRLKILLDKLASVKLDSLSHHQKLVFWINIYNASIMNAFLENGVPENPDMFAAHMQKATIKVVGQVLNALMIEHLILRLPYHLKHTCSKSAKTDESKVCRTFGLEWSEPLVTFALSCGSWSSPAVRVYTASQIETELEAAKRDYLQATVAISTRNKLIIPKLLDWYVLDFAKDLDSLLDWVCMQLPDELRTKALKCIERKGKDQPLSELVHVVPYNFTFRYLICR